MNLKKIATISVMTIIVVLITFAVVIWSITFHPKQTEYPEVFSISEAPVLKPGQKIRVLNYNVQYMASKNYVFFYDYVDGNGPDDRPSPEDITKTINRVAKIIIDENPDVILLQEVNDGAKATDYEDQLERLMKLLPKEYVSYTSAFYWKAGFVPHPRIMGPVGMKLATISKYKLSKAIRHQLATIPSDPLTHQFNFKRAILEARLPVEGGKDFVVMNTHLDAFSQGTDTMQRQVAFLKELLIQRGDEGFPWIIGGDFNLLPPGQYDSLQESERHYFQKETEMQSIYDQFNVIPALEDLNKGNDQQWNTHLPNGLGLNAPDRILDYYVYSNNLSLLESYVRHKDTYIVSDHLPIIAEFKLPQ